MDELESKNEKQQKKQRFGSEFLKKGLRFDPDQYEFLKECSEKGEEGIKEWNEWRKKNANKDIKLDGQSFYGFYLKGIYLNSGRFIEGETGSEYHFGGEVYLENADFRQSHLERSYFHRADLTGGKFASAHLEHSILYSAVLEDADFRAAIVNGETSLVRSKVSRRTNFVSVGLNNLRIDPGTKQLLEYNIRWKNWEEWYKEHSRLKWLVKPFWWISDYGLRTWRVIVWFFGLAIVFGVVYWLWPSCVMVNQVVGDIRGFWHALYFSVGTMTTLGFGDIAANPDSWGGQTLLMIQVILGYVLLGALVTRFAVLFTAGGPAGKFTD